MDSIYDIRLIHVLSGDWRPERRERTTSNVSFRLGSFQKLTARLYTLIVRFCRTLRLQKTDPGLWHK
jgi:hypothetical protein